MPGSNSESKGSKESNQERGKSPYAANPRKKESPDNDEILKAAKKRWESRPGGYQYTYTGVLKMSPEKQQTSVKRLSKYDPSKLPCNSKRVADPRVAKTCGILGSYQWSAGGSQTHGFMH